MKVNTQIVGTSNICLYQIILLTLLLCGCTNQNNEKDLGLQRGENCKKGAYPKNVNLQFENIWLQESLRLIAGFSCNEIEFKNVKDKVISTNYTEVPWKNVVRDICSKNSLTCRAENGVLTVTSKPQEKIPPSLALFLGLGSIFLICALVWTLGMYYQKHLNKARPNSPYLEKMSVGDIIWNILFVALIVILIAVRQLAPNSFLGALLDNWYNWILLVVTFYVLGVVRELMKNFWKQNDE